MDPIQIKNILGIGEEIILLYGLCHVLANLLMAWKLIKLGLTLAVTRVL